MRRVFFQLTSLLFLVLSTISIAAQDDDQTRSITSDDFAKNRPAGRKRTSTSPREGGGRVKQTYALIRRDKNRLRWKPVGKTARKSTATTAATRISDIGLTIWRLRPPLARERGLKLPVLNEGGVRQMWIPERVSAKATFRAEDKVRFAVESANEGYLYVINSEILEGGTFGQPKLIYPDPIDEPNTIRPGLLVDFPDQTETWPYFKISPKRPGFTGELLMIVVSPNKLEFQVDSDGWILNAGDVIDTEAEFEAEVFDRSDNADKLYTAAEAKAACGSKTRQLTREKTSDPCDSATRQLTREEPTPQSIYRVKSASGQPAIVFVRLNASQ